MADGDDLDRRLRRALGAVPAAGPPPGARQALLSGLGRRRARRRQVLAGAAVTALAVAVVAVGLWSGGRPVHTTAPPVLRPAPSTTQPGRLAPSAGATAVPACAEVRLGGASATCAGGYSVPSNATFSAEPAAAAPTAVADLPPAQGSGSPGAPPEELSVGESLTVDLPAEGTLAWGVPRVEHGTAAGTGKGPVLRVARAAAGRPGTRARLSVRALRPGVAELVVGAGGACAGGGGRCAASALVWTLQVMVEGT